MVTLPPTPQNSKGSHKQGPGPWGWGRDRRVSGGEGAARSAEGRDAGERPAGWEAQEFAVFCASDGFKGSVGLKGFGCHVWGFTVLGHEAERVREREREREGPRS